jgi:hypothetical protein
MHGRYPMENDTFVVRLEGDDKSISFGPCETKLYYTLFYQFCPELGSLGNHQPTDGRTLLLRVGEAAYFYERLLLFIPVQGQVDSEERALIEGLRVWLRDNLKRRMPEFLNDPAG